jgi:hypothetical protein
MPQVALAAKSRNKNDAAKKSAGKKFQARSDAPAQRLRAPDRVPNYFSASGKSIENHGK